MSKSVTVYTTQYCPHCRRAKYLLDHKGIEYTEMDLTQDDALRSQLEEKTNWMTVPMIFIGQEFIGGADELYDLESKGELDQKVQG